MQTELMPCGPFASVVGQTPANGARPPTDHRMRALMVWMIRLWPDLLAAAVVVKPETILRWHRAGFRGFWRWKSRRAGRPKIDRDLRDLIRQMSTENPTWGASRIHGELLMLGLEIAQSTVSKYMRTVENHHRKAGKRFCAITLRRLLRSTCALCGR